MIETLGRVVADTGAHHLPGAFDRFSGTLHHYGYFAVAVALVVENFGVPLPGQIVLIAAALYAATGGLNIFVVVIVGIIASTVGAGLGYALGLYGGRPLAERFGKYVLLTPERLDKTQDFFARRGRLVVTLGRFVDGVRQACGIIAGLSEMTLRPFLIFSFIGAALWVSAWSAVGYTAGDHITTISKYAGYVAAALGVVVVLFIARVIVENRRRKRTGAESDVDGEPQESPAR